MPMRRKRVVRRPYRAKRPRRRNAPGRRAYVKRRKIYKRKQRTAVSRRTTFPRTLDIGTQHPAEITYNIPYMDTMTVWPSIVDSTSYPSAVSVPKSWGGACKSIWANCPNFVYKPDGGITPLTPVGRWMHDGLTAGDDNGVNSQVQTPSAFYNSMIVTKAMIEVVFTPIDVIPTDDTEINPSDPLTEGIKWNPEALCYINFNKDWNHFVGGTGLAVDQMEGTSIIRESKYTRTGTTQLSTGAKPQSVKLRGSYNPHLLWHFKDMGDDPNFDVGVNLPTATSQPTVPTNPAFWQIGVMSPNPLPVVVPVGFPISSPTVEMVRGVPLPHRVDIKVVYTCKFFNPRSNVSFENIQIGPI